MRKDMKLTDLKQHIADAIQSNVKDLRFWTFMRRHNGTIRIDSPLVDTPADFQLRQIQLTRVLSYQLPVLYVENLSNYDTTTTDLDYTRLTCTNNIIIHIKYYDPFLKKLSGVGNLFLNESTCFRQILPNLCHFRNLPFPQDFLLYEEVYPGSISRLSLDSSLKEAQFQSGDILTFQLPIPNNGPNNLDLPTIPDYYDYLFHCVSVTFSPIPSSSSLSSPPSPPPPHPSSSLASKSVTLNLNLNLPYSSVASQLATALNISDPSKLRISSSPSSSPPLRILPSTSLADLLPYINKQSLPSIAEHSLYYELLDLSLDQLDKLRSFSITFTASSLRSSHSFDILVDKSASCQLLFALCYPKISAFLTDSSSSLPNPLPIRFYLVSNCQISTVLSASDLISSIPEFPTPSIIAELLPSVTDLPLSSSPSLTSSLSPPPSSLPTISINVFHFHKILSHTHSIPFLLTLFPNEPFFPDTALRIKSKLGITSDKEFSKILFYFVPHSATTKAESRPLLPPPTSSSPPPPPPPLPAPAPALPSDNLNDLQKCQGKDPDLDLSSDLSLPNPFYLYHLITNQNDSLAIEHPDRKANKYMTDSSAIKILN
ncbi:putative ubiquitin carboxyl-terminal hydrolase 5 [Zancudomyces culisetae]|uniref:ubiquitinyl hydrolase 1 n=2 Tax=Zancudomyces culisetae TaxID=1213189 RepID=A0A1R1PPJ1_ZANCU|nr:putative ubiquitin carboxyl-terminal hydrolase 5 [Zancudomyces culisetae]|eukprot:OMH82823.1 putative ubiquitin carboxyl-terminal hydrolase 5 [Zancudomyces culisetae]